VPGDAPPRPVGTYALTKALSEEIARHYATRYGLEVITLRIAAPLDVNDPSLANHVRLLGELRLRQPGALPRSL
jgi:nucleoside-diphosphate-sugar epimerase